MLYSSCMLQVVLFDLDDTLLDNDMSVFMPRFFELIGAHVASTLPERPFIRALKQSARAMMANVDPARPNEVVFWEHLAATLGRDQAELEPLVDAFYAEDFHRLRSVTKPVTGALEAVEVCLSQGYGVVVATNPVFPLAAIQARLDWAGVGHLPYRLVTSYENTHFTKPRLEYYREILDALRCPASAALMVGNDIEQDLKPALALGLEVFKVQTPRNGHQHLPNQPSGTFNDLKRRLELHKRQ